MVKRLIFAIHEDYRRRVPMLIPFTRRQRQASSRAVVSPTAR